MGTAPVSGIIVDMTLVGDFLVMLREDGLLRVYNVENPGNPFWIDEYQVGTSGQVKESKQVGWPTHVPPAASQVNEMSQDTWP